MTADGSGTYTYTGRSQMASATVSSATTNYTYDADGARVVKATPTKTTYYIRGVGNVLAEYTATEGLPSLDREYVYLGSRLLAALTQSEDEPDTVAAVTGISLSAGSITAGGSVTATVSGESLPCAQVKITWGDGNSASYPLSSPYALPLAQGHTYSGAGLFTIVAEGESGCGGKVSTSVEVRSAQIVTNGNFSGGLNEAQTAPAGWQIYTDGSVAWGIDGLFGFYRATDSTYAVLLQQQSISLPAGAPLEASFKLGNTDTVGRQVRVYVRSADWTDLAVCTFYLPASQSLTTYTMRTHTTVAWTVASIDLYILDATITPYQIDDVSLVYAPGNSSAKTECVDPNAPTSGGSTSGNLLSNGDFASGTSSWTLSSTSHGSVSSGVLNFYGNSSETSPWPTVLQGFTSMSANQRIAAVFDLGNSSTSRQQVSVWVQGTTAVGCSFYLPANSPKRTFAILTYAPVSWTSGSILLYPGDVGSESSHGWLQLDNVSVSRITTTIAGLECLEPGSFTLGGGAPEPSPLPALEELVGAAHRPRSTHTTVLPLNDSARIATDATIVTEAPDGSKSVPPVVRAALWTMNLLGTGSGTVTSSPSGIACGGHEITCVGLFVENTSITFTATPATGQTFGGWGGACSGFSPTCIVSGVGAQTVEATFDGPPEVTYYHADTLGSVRAITDSVGDPVTRLDYAPFGESTATLAGNPKKFTGQDRDAETAFDYFGARYYRNVWGRFTSADDSSFMTPLDPQTFNSYAYVLNNPLRYIDPEGHQAREPQAPPCTPNNCTTVSTDRCTGRCAANEIQLRIDGLILFWQGPRHPVTGEVLRPMFPEPTEGQLAFLDGAVNLASVIPLIADIRAGIQVGRAAMNSGRLLLNTSRGNLLAGAKNAGLRNMIEQLYKKTATIGSGSTADAIRYELRTGELLSPAGHSIKGADSIRALENIIASGGLDSGDLQIAQGLITDLRKALAGR